MFHCCLALNVRAWPIVPIRAQDANGSNRCVGDINDAGLTLARDYEQSTKYLLTPYSGSVPSSGSP